MFAAEMKKLAQEKNKTSVAQYLAAILPFVKSKIKDEAEHGKFQVRLELNKDLGLAGVKNGRHAQLEAVQEALVEMGFSWTADVHHTCDNNDNECGECIVTHVDVSWS
jgi:hypothetical protein